MSYSRIKQPNNMESKESTEQSFCSKLLNLYNNNISKELQEQILALHHFTHALDDSGKELFNSRLLVKNCIVASEHLNAPNDLLNSTVGELYTNVAKLLALKPSSNENSTEEKTNAPEGYFLTLDTSETVLDTKIAVGKQERFFDKSTVNEKVLNYYVRQVSMATAKGNEEAYFAQLYRIFSHEFSSQYKLQQNVPSTFKIAYIFKCFTEIGFTPANKHSQDYAETARLSTKLNHVLYKLSVLEMLNSLAENFIALAEPVKTRSSKTRMFSKTQSISMKQYIEKTINTGNTSQILRMKTLIITFQEKNWLACRQQLAKDPIGRRIFNAMSLPDKHDCSQPKGTTHNK